MIKTRVREGLTVFFTTHILDEAEYLCDRVAIINRGKIVAVETPKKLKERFGGLQTVEALVDGGDLERLRKELSSVSGVSKVWAEDGRVIKVETSNPGEIFKIIASQVERMGLRIVSLNLRDPTLEEAFVRLVNENQ